MKLSDLRGLAPAILLAVGLSLVLAVPSDAQYFGRNKVRYESFDFQVLKTEHFDIHYYPRDNEVIEDVARMAERWYERLSRTFDHKLTERKPIILYANHADFQQTNVLSGFVSEGTGGVTESLKSRVILPLTGDYFGTDHVLGHELVHAFQFDIAAAQEDTIPFRLNFLPLYLIEGMAEYLSVGREDPHTAMWMRDALLSEDGFPTVRDLATNSRFFPYRFGQALWAFIGGTWGDQNVPLIYGSAGRRGFEYAVGKHIGISEDSLSTMWAAAIEAQYRPAMKIRAVPRDLGTRILAEDIDAGNMNLAPVLSADGRKVAFLSERDLFSIDLFVADAHTGKISKKLVSSATNPHFDALRFIDSAGSWSPDGRRLAVVVFARGNNEIVLLDAARGSVEQKVRPQGVGAISNPAWSPDGRTIAFTGSRNGVSNLYLWDIQAGTFETLTDDAHAELQPAWSPDGTRIAFATDEGPGTDLAQLSYADMRIGVLDLATGGTRIYAPFENAKHINPQFSPDGRSLYFISDRGGFSDIYRLGLDTDEVYQVTNVATGVSGITALSPALSVASESGRVLFSVFSDGKYTVHGMDAEDAQGTRVDPAEPVDNGPGILPPDERTDSVAEYLTDPITGLPRDPDFPIVAYHPKIQLDYIGGVAAGGVSTDRYGSGLGGAVTAYFSDMLGDHTIGVGVQANGTIKDVGAQGFYLNRKHRWNWGGQVGHIPYFSYSTSVRDTFLTSIGRNGLKVEQIQDRVFLDRASALASYPFSTTRRIEFGAGFSYYSFDREVLTETVVDGLLFSRTEQDIEDPAGLGLVQASVALVGDNSFFGFTSPIRGGRFRLEVEPTFGTLNYQTLLADYRRYFAFRQTTFAVRGLHIGRYGGDANSNRLGEFFLGNAALVRGYTSGSFDLAECTDGSGGDCPEFDRLIGSRLGVFNAELRLPLIGTEQYGLLNFPYLPTELVGFLDAGVAWNRGDGAELKFERNSSERVPVFSTGLAARFNILGALILESYYAFPLQRPLKSGGVFGIQLIPGW